MAFNDFLAGRVSHFFDEKGIPFVVKKMMEGLCFMVNDKMRVGNIKDEIMARINPDVYE